jgi:SPP1 gp7 family putative phage head morphogenesis protein
MLNLTQKQVDSYFISLFNKVATGRTREGLIRKFDVRGIEWYELNLVRYALKKWRSVTAEFLEDEEHKRRIQILLDSAVERDSEFEIPDEALNLYHEFVRNTLIENWTEEISDDEDSIDLIESSYAEAKVTTEERILNTIKRIELETCKIEISKQGIGYDFDENDQRAIDSLSDGYFYWMGETYDSGLSDSINNLAMDVLNRGLGEEDIADTFMRELGDKYTGRGKAYFTILASNVANTARSYGSMNTYKEFEITDWEYLAILDLRTTPICESLDGKICSVERAIGTMEEVITARSPEDVKSLKPFLKWDDEEQKPYYETETELVYIPIDGTPEELNSYGFLFPPNHYLCRSTTIPYFRTEVRNYRQMLTKFESIGVSITFSNN